MSGLGVGWNVEVVEVWGPGIAGPEEAQPQAGEEAASARARPDKEDWFLERGFKSMCSIQRPLSNGAARVFRFSFAGV